MRSMAVPGHNNCAREKGVRNVQPLLQASVAAPGDGRTPAKEKARREIAGLLFSKVTPPLPCVAIPLNMLSQHAVPAG